MNTFFTIYIGVWAALCLIAVGLAVSQWTRLEITQRAYWQKLFRPWEVTTFAI